jgi:hypothetical protein
VVGELIESEFWELVSVSVKDERSGEGEAGIVSSVNDSMASRNTGTLLSRGHVSTVEALDGERCNLCL